MNLLTIAETAKLLKCSEAHVRSLCLSGKLQFIDIAQKGTRKQFRIPESAIAAMLENK